MNTDGKACRHTNGENFPSQMFMKAMKDVIYGTYMPYSLAEKYDITARVRDCARPL